MLSRTLLLAVLATLALPVAASERIRIVNEGGIKDEWTLPPGAKLAAPSYPAEYAESPEDVCVVIGYLVNPDGHTSDFALLKSWSSGDNSSSRTEFWEAFARAASGALAQWQFAPRPEVKSPRPTYTVGTFVFGSQASQGLREQCVIRDVPTRLVELRYDRRAGKLMTRGIFKQLAIDPALEDRVWQKMRLANGSDINDAEIMARRSPPPPPPPPPAQAP